MLLPKQIFLTKGVGRHKEELTSFELALRSAGIAACNLVTVSSIFPGGCKLIQRPAGLRKIKPGEVIFAVMSQNRTKEPHRLIAASVGLALPSDHKTYGYLSEHHSFGCEGTGDSREATRKPANMPRNWLPKCWPPR